MNQQISLDTLTKEQRQAVTHQGTPLLILAGAGSGKTRALTYKAAYLIAEKNVLPEQILLTTFTNKAAEEMQSRVFALTNQKLPFTGTFHSLCARMLRMHGNAIGIGQDFVIYDTNDQVDAIKMVMQELGLDPQTIKPKGVAAAIDSAKNELINPSEYENFARGPFQQAVARIYRAYQLRLFEYHALDFTDLLTKTVYLFQQSDSVRNHYQHQFQHVLIDEYQDTNKAQYALTKLWLGPHQNLCVVGDASQAIYSWRGADYHNLLSLETDFPNLTTIRLEQNFRSTQNILDAAFGVINQNQLHPILKLWTESSDGEKVNLYAAQDEYDEARYIAKQVKQYQRNGGLLADNAVLFRTNAQSRVFEEVFMEQSIPYVLVGGVKFYERKEVKDIIAYIRLIYNPADKVSRKRLEKVGKRRLAAVESWQTSQKDIESLTPLQILEGVIESSNYLGRFDPNNPEDQARIENVAELKSVAASFPTLETFLENIALSEAISRNRQSEDAVTLMTLHASKGLEFNQVFIAGMEEGIFPHSRSINSRPDLEEERRLCYVGMTRAQQKLYLSFASRRMYFGVQSQNPISRFIEEIPEEVLNTNLRAKQTRVTVDDSLVSDFMSGKIDIDAFLDS